ncbi:MULTISPECIES: polysaccharide deacetylase family protein [unclassified Shinella]|uniref:polysaccharide deacetylase family protein n=1 Tax=unclassified Shinella TaxID=2643062 RepID=UPI00225DC6B6|nr:MULTISPECIES: polysaccharide deacetylase family protein [unclassified Shinella]MCO5138136.1 polysaccharide deacetylase family protein [Shinella sp.]MDC7258253.1 polysaccharide deacetylase family protein [Shinella sp. YE25]CAI0335734.1 Chitooligosaccharide deacetylase [Rhizobiaceae bacterium]CAK7260037.1 Chitooligosaccharide deacetylase [Shinella sp. WSC3-e]
MLANTLYLTFHGIGAPIVPPAEGELRYFVTEEVFRRTIAGLDDLEAKTGVEAYVTFDDGNLSDYDVALPVLADHGRSGIFFVLAGRIGQKGYLSAAQIRDIAAAGMTVGSHGHDHVDWRSLDEAGYRRELVDARRKIEDVLGAPVAYASIPFGGFDRSVLRRLKAERYDRVFTSSTGLAYRDVWFCPRRSLTETFDPRSGLLPLARPGAKARGLAYRIARRLRYRW